MIQIDWTNLKALSTSKAIPLQYVEGPTVYTVYAVDESFVTYCVIDKSPSDTTDLDDFVNNYKAISNIPLNQQDTDGAKIVRIKAAKRGWTYCALPFEFSTSRLGSTDLYSKMADGTDRSGISMKIYNASDVEITTPGLLGANLATAVKTVIDLEPAYDYELIGGTLRTLTDILSDMRLWIIAVPDISAASGGSKEMAGGVNLRYLSPGNEYHVDGRVSKSLTYSATYHTNKLRFILKYPAGEVETIAVTVEMYKA